MKIEHIALWVQDLEKVKEFYQKYFNAQAGEKYRNEGKKFESYFLTFEGGSRLEIMQMEGIASGVKDHAKQQLGYVHLAMEAGSREEVDRLTEIFRKDGYAVVGEPRLTGDGYYESVILDPENNLVELVA